MRGRKPTPIEQRVRQGNPQRRPLPAPVVVGERVDQLEPPADLPEEAREAWREVVPKLSESGLLQGVDRLALELMFTQYARAKQAGRVVAEQGHVALGSTGQITEHPSMATERNATNLFAKFMEQYGLTPVARTRLGLAELERVSLAKQMERELGPNPLTDPPKGEVVEGEAVEA
jgi:P27 family predicted phage terminase small subunit